MKNKADRNRLLADGNRALAGFSSALVGFFFALVEKISALADFSLSIRVVHRLSEWSIPVSFPLIVWHNI